MVDQRMRRVLRRSIGGAIIVLLVSACQTGTWFGAAGDPKVAVIGDSLLYHAEGNYNSPAPRHLLSDELVAHGYQAHVSAYVGESVQAGRAQLWPLVASEPDLDTLVIALGTNDSHDGAVPRATSRAEIAAWLADAADVRCVALIGINVQAWAWHLDTYGPPFNQMLQEEAARHPNAIYVPWEPDLAIHGTTGDVHMPTEAGQAQYRATVLDAVDRCAATNPATTTTTTSTTTPDETTTTVGDTTTTIDDVTTTTTVPEPTTIPS
jgi:lysophospholipase L1-like esterase